MRANQQNPIYDPDKVCGDYGGRTTEGRPCKQPAGWKSLEADDGRCYQHDRAAESFASSKKAEILALLPEVGNLQQVANATGVVVRTIFAWRQADAVFREEFEAIVTSRDKSRAANVEDKVYERIMADKASPAETIFFLKNRDPDRWRDVYEERNANRRAAQGQGPLAPVDTAKARLSKKLTSMARRAAESTRAVDAHAEASRATPSDVAARIQREVDKDTHQIDQAHWDEAGGDSTELTDE